MKTFFLALTLVLVSIFSDVASARRHFYYPMLPATPYNYYQPVLPLAPWYVGAQFPGFNWSPWIRPGYYQCTAFNSYFQSALGTGLTLQQAASNALFYCGGPYVCYIPWGYCNYYNY